MRAEAQAALCLLLGATALRLGLTDAALAFVKANQRPLLVAGGVVLVAVGLLGLLRPSGVDEHPAPRAAWLLALPVAVVFVVAPAPLGSYAAQRQSDARAFERGPISAPLPAEVDGAVPMGLREFLLRAVNGRELESRTVRLVGFTSTDRKGVVLNRFRVTCCAADGIAMRVRLAEFPGTPADDSWWVVEGRLLPGERGSDGGLAGLPVLEVTQARTTAQPANAYET